LLPGFFFSKTPVPLLAMPQPGILDFQPPQPGPFQVSATDGAVDHANGILCVAQNTVNLKQISTTGTKTLVEGVDRAALRAEDHFVDFHAGGHQHRAAVFTFNLLVRQKVAR
jgi:hypothetical protein